MVQTQRRPSLWKRSKAKLGNWLKRSKQVVGKAYRSSGLKNLVKRSRSKLAGFGRSISNKYKNSRLKRSLDKLVASIRRSIGKKGKVAAARPSRTSARRLTISRA